MSARCLHEFHVRHGRSRVAVHPATAAAYALVPGQRISDRELRHLVHCTWFVDRVEDRFATLCAMHAVRRAMGRAAR